MKSAMLIMTVLVLLLGVVLFERLKTPRQQTEAVTTNKKTIQAESAVDTKVETGNDSAAVREIPLDIERPLTDSLVESSSILVQGKTVPNATVYINEVEFKADNIGVFAQNINLEEGENYISIIAHDENGRFAEELLTVIVVN